jgi:16S rRNA (adenine1518-N6/adenine1519-N6)-dimethyltransferase
MGPGPGAGIGRDPGGLEGVLARLRRAGLRPRKGLGQHFLHDPKILAEIAEAGRLEPGDAVLEVGTGPGTLTRQLAARAGRVLTVEVDREMLEFARGEIGGDPKVRILEMDALDGKGRLNPALRTELEALGPFKLVANLPYAIATPLILEIFAGDLPIRLAAVTVQRELAARLGAPAGSRDYSPATVLLAFWARAEPVRTLPPGAFWPPPAVTSEVLRIVPRATPLGDRSVYPAYSAWAHRLLGHRRKQVGGLLRGWLGREGAAEALGRLGLDGRERPDRIQPEGFLDLAGTFEFDSRCEEP